MSLLQTTPPSFYDTERGWYGTIGKAELEWDALAVTVECQEQGDRWQPVMVRGRWVEMTEAWLSRLQRVRHRLPGPPEMIRNKRARGGLQLRFPEGRLRGASFDYSDRQLAEFRQLDSLGVSDGA